MAERIGAIAYLNVRLRPRRVSMRSSSQLPRLLFSARRKRRSCALSLRTLMLPRYGDKIIILLTLFHHNDTMCCTVVCALICYRNNQDFDWMFCDLPYSSN
uniref:Uncharacterized protein n=1 Tax=Ditylenchus dipsaci TaxID=166011 RepID=A0A915DPR1_9BILA